jgi:hypothetical protein
MYFSLFLVLSILGLYNRHSLPDSLWSSSRGPRSKFLKGPFALHPPYKKPLTLKELNFHIPSLLLMDIMGKRASKKGSASGCQEDSKSRNSQTELFAGPSVTDATLQQSVLDLLRGIYDEGSGDLRSSVHRNKVSQAIRDRMDKMQGEIQIHSDSRDSVVDILYTMFKLLQAQWNKQGPSKSSKQPEPPAPSENPKPATQLENTQPPGSTFDQTGLSVVPDADVQIITHDNPGQPLPVRLSDLLPDSNDLTHRTLNGGWV